jgi:hypothetical protein
MAAVFFPLPPPEKNDFGQTKLLRLALCYSAHSPECIDSLFFSLFNMLQCPGMSSIYNLQLK